MIHLKANQPIWERSDKNLILTIKSRFIKRSSWEFSVSFTLYTPRTTSILYLAEGKLGYQAFYYMPIDKVHKVENSLVLNLFFITGNRLRIINSTKYTHIPTATGRK